MTKSEKYNELRARINKNCPELLEPGSGCEVTLGNDVAVIVQNQTDSAGRIRFKDMVDGEIFRARITDVKILGHPPQLQHVLRAVEESVVAAHRFNIRADGMIFFDDGFTDYTPVGVNIHYDFSLPLSEQEESVLDFLLDVIE